MQCAFDLFRAGLQTPEPLTATKDRTWTPIDRLRKVPHPYQEDGILRLRSYEDALYQGGLLADAMGLGKTLELLALILIDKQETIAKAYPNSLRP